jgi:hypothetical protein
MQQNGSLDFGQSRLRSRCMQNIGAKEETFLAFKRSSTPPPGVRTRGKRESRPSTEKNGDGLGHGLVRPLIRNGWTSFWARGFQKAFGGQPTSDVSRALQRGVGV